MNEGVSNEAIAIDFAGAAAHQFLSTAEYSFG